MSSPVQGITGQVRIIYEKAIAEIEQEEAEIESQIGKLIEKKAVLSKKREDINRLRTQVAELTDEISVAEEAYQEESHKKDELDVQVRKMTEALSRLKAESQNVENKLNQTRTTRRSRYQMLAEMVEKFGESVTSKLSDQVVAGLERKIQDSEASATDNTEDTEEIEGDLSLPGPSKSDKGINEALKSEATQVMDTHRKPTELDDENQYSTDDEDTLLEDVTTRMSAVLGLNPPNEEEPEDTLADQDESDFEDSVKSSRIRAVPRKSSTEAERLKQILESRHSEGEAGELDEGSADLEFGQAEEEASHGDAVDMDEIDRLLSQSNSAEHQTNENLPVEDDEEPPEAEEEQLTPKTAQTPRKRRKLLENYLPE